MLEARRLPPHMFSALGSSMRHILHRSMNSSTMTRVMTLVKGMQDKDEGQQLTAVIEMCQVWESSTAASSTSLPASHPLFVWL